MTHHKINKALSPKSYCLFIDESGTANLDSYQTSPYFTLCGVLIAERHREKLRVNFEKLKKKYFRRQSFVIHSSSLKADLKRARKKEDEFARDLTKALNSSPFYLFFVTLDKKVARQRGWAESKTVYIRSYRALLDNLVKFLVAKNIRGNIYTEASSPAQDIYLYKGLHHFLSQGIREVAIDPSDVKQHLTSLSYVTKINDDPEEQIADLFGTCGKIHREIGDGKLEVENLGPINQALYELMPKRLMKIKNATSPKKKKLYRAINPFVVLL